MFSIIDNKLIIGFQWLVRQIELYTNKTRKDVIELNLSVLKFFLLTLLFPLGILFYELILNGNVAFVVLIAFYLFFVFCSVSGYWLLKNTKINSYHSTELPKEIVTRIFGRTMISVVSVQAFCLMAFIANLESFQIGDSIFEKPITVIMSAFPFFTAFLFFCFEYFLCTTSIPPGEKEERKIKKEMEQMKLQPIKIR